VTPALPPPLTDQADDIDRVWDVFFIGALVVFAFVLALIVYVVVRHRRRRPGLPRQVRENIPYEIAYTAIPFLIVVGLFGLTYASIRAVDAADEDVDVEVEVIGFQWQWQFNYAGSGVSVIGTETERPELVLPADSTVQFDLRSIDVVHSFFIPGFRYKRDLFPGQTQTFRVDVDDQTGTYEDGGACAEFCGLDHDKMRFDVRIVTPDEFQRWLAEERSS
jgi:cytochrome c oxidase subunit II